jgi:uncharacterized protein (TIGR00725 family)
MPGICINNNNKNNYLIPKIGVSGAADIGFLKEDAYELAKEVGREIARQGAIMMSGATTGFPYWAAVGCKEECGVSVGLSPAESVREHTEVYRLPLENMDFITFTGFGYSGRDLLFTRSCDAIIIGPGRIGTFHEFTISFEDQKPIGILKGDGEWATDDILKVMIKNSHRPNKKIVFDDNPKRLIAKLLDLVAEDRKLIRGYKNYDGVDSSKDGAVL